MLELFITYLLDMAGRSLYVWGAQGESIRSIVATWIKSKETSSKNAQRVMNHLEKLLEHNLFFYDCSGLGVKWLLEKKLIKSDMTANSMYKICTPIKKTQLKKGDWVFIKNASGIMTHIGYIVDDNLSVVESAGRDVGVIKRDFSQGSPNGKWTDFARPDSLFPELKEDKLTISRVLKLTQPYMRGDDVKALQGKIGEKEDGIFGPDTEEKVKEIQDQLGLVVDGKAGENTLTELGFEWNG